MRVAGSSRALRYVKRLVVLSGCGAVLAVGTRAADANTGPSRRLDGFEEVGRWEAHPADGVAMSLTSDRGAVGVGMRLDYDFRGRGGWASARRRLSLELPDNWELAFFWRGTPARQTLEVKLLDSSGENVWWVVRRDVRPPQGWERVVIKKRHLSFAWGPAGAGELTWVGQIELTITAAEGGSGSVWFDELVFTPLPTPQPYRGTPVVSASSAVVGSGPALAMDGDPTTFWRFAAADGPEPWLMVDFGTRREFGGLVITWGDGAAAGAFAVQLSADGKAWETAWEVEATHGLRSFVPLPEADARFVRLRMADPPPGGIAVAEVELQPLEFAATPNDFVAAVATRSRRGLYPRGFLGEMSRWTLVGTSPGGNWRGLLGADGAFEVSAGSFSLEPFVVCEGHLVTWADVTTTQALLPGGVPIPTVSWSHPCFTLDITALVTEVGAPPASLVRYRLTDRREPGGNPAALVVAVRPFEVNPPSQFLGHRGGVAEPQSMTVSLASALLEPAGLLFVPYPRPSAVAAVPFDGGDIAALLERGEWPHRRASGPYPSAAWRWELDSTQKPTLEVVVAMPHEGGGWQRSAAARREAGEGEEAFNSSTFFAAQLERTAAAWRERLAAVEIDLPRAARELLDTARANLAFALINRDGPALQPGARAYRRAWIRDAAMMGIPLLRLGRFEEVTQFARWYASFQYEDGKVPCCVDQRGADPVAEHDSDGQFIFLVAEAVRITGDRVFAAELWPAVRAAARHIDALRARRRTTAWRAGEAQRFFGLLPESISHEGYSAKPMHSYWDTFWAVRGLDDAATLAATLGHVDQARQLAASRDELRGDLIASLGLAMRHHRIDYLPGCAELGDFDATSTAVALAPLGLAHWLPVGAVEHTFETYWSRFVARRDGIAPWRDFTPYELRAVPAFVRLGWRERAWELLSWFLGYRQPSSWLQWPEIVWSDSHTARFVGDLPHSWVGSEYVRAFLDLFAFEREEDAALVLAAGVPAGWLDSGETVGVKGLRTRYGPMSYAILGREGVVRVRVDSGSSLPPGGVVVALPGIPPGWEGKANGKTIRASARGEFLLSELPCELLVVRPQGSR